MVSSIDGLVSGMSTSSVITQLMQVEAQGQTRLKDKATAQQKVVSSYQAINTKIASLKTAATTLTDSPAWKSIKATSSSDAVTVSASAGAKAGQITFDVKRLAQANVQTTMIASAETDIEDGTGIVITAGGTTTSITPQTHTAQGVVDAINSANIGVKASLVEGEQGTFLQLNATKTGAANAFTITGIDATFTEVSAGLDAQLGVGTPGAGGYTVASATNTFTNLLPNVSITAKKVEAGVTVSVNPDADAIASKVQAMVEAANGLLSEIGTQSAINTSGTSTSGAPLAGNFLVRQVHQNVLSAVSGGMEDFGSFKQIGVQTDRTGKLTFDKAAFVEAYTADPTKVKDVVSTGLAKSLKDIASTANTNVTSAIQTGTNNIRGLNAQVDDWDVRLTARREALVKQFANMETALGKMQQQSNWLAGQINALG